MRFLLVWLGVKGSNKFHSPTNKPIPLSFNSGDRGVVCGEAFVYGCGDCSEVAAGENNTLGTAAGSGGSAAGDECAGTGGDGSAAGGDGGGTAAGDDSTSVVVDGSATVVIGTATCAISTAVGELNNTAADDVTVAGDPLSTAGDNSTSVGGESTSAGVGVPVTAGDCSSAGVDGTAAAWDGLGTTAAVVGCTSAGWIGTVAAGKGSATDSDGFLSCDFISINPKSVERDSSKNYLRLAILPIFTVEYVCLACSYWVKHKVKLITCKF